jgi:bifunctional NMN adenylyltransferase/nudix hydrolase
MEIPFPKSDAGIIIGRFQVPELHASHIDLIQSVRKNHPKVIIFLGVSPLLISTNNPLDFESRKQMILEKFPDVTVLYLKDTKYDAVWSKRLDEQIHDVVSDNQTVSLYGSRDSFISHYSGKFPVVELESKSHLSGSDIRKSIKAKVRPSYDFRAGVIWAALNRFKQTYHTVDIAIFDVSETEVLLGKKAYNDKWQFIGGFTNPDSESDEADARREVIEETGLEITELQYIGSCNVIDWRYKNEVDKIRTSLFKTHKVFGHAKANDDIAEVKWFKIDEVVEVLDEMHMPLWNMLVAHTEKTKTN